MRYQAIKTIMCGLVAAAVPAVTALAGPLTDRIAAGEPIRIGFANEIPWAYPGEGNEPLGFANAHALGVLESMGFDNIEPVVTEWGGLIPGLRAGRFDIITGGMYILEARCENVAFAEPMGIFGDAFLVEAGNPHQITTYEDIRDGGHVMVTGAGYNTIEVARSEGIEDENVMQVPGPTEILAAMRANRAEAGALTYFTALNLAEQSDGALEVTDPSALPDWTMNWVGIAFHPDDQDFLAEFNAAQADYLGSDEMLERVAEFQYSEAQLPGNITTAWICANR